MALFSACTSGVILATTDPNVCNIALTSDVSSELGESVRKLAFDVSLSAVAVELPLRSAFGTSHSITTFRTNSRLTITIRIRDVLVADGEAVRAGWSEIGMPPKKPYVYEAALEDVPGACAHAYGNQY